MTNFFFRLYTAELNQLLFKTYQSYEAELLDRRNIKELIIFQKIRLEFQ